MAPWLVEPIGVLLVDHSGRILAREHGGFDYRKTMRLSAALERSSDAVAARSSALSLGTTSGSDRRPPSLARHAGALADS